MKTTIILFLCFIAFAFTLVNKPSGKWKLEKVEADGKTILPESEKFIMIVSDAKIDYFDGCNWCLREIDSMNTVSIQLKGHNNCTKKACVNLDPIAKYIDYSGKYKLQDSLLIITNTKGKLYLIKEKE